MTKNNQIVFPHGINIEMIAVIEKAKVAKRNRTAGYFSFNHETRKIAYRRLHKCYLT